MEVAPRPAGLRRRRHLHPERNALMHSLLGPVTVAQMIEDGLGKVFILDREVIRGRPPARAVAVGRRQPAGRSRDDAVARLAPQATGCRGPRLFASAVVAAARRAG